MSQEQNQNYDLENETTESESVKSDVSVEAGTDSESHIDGNSDLAQQLADKEQALAYLAAEFENYKRQTSRRLDEERQRAARSLLNEILPALDNFALAQQYADSAKDVASLKTGLDFVAQQLESALRNAGLEPIEATGQQFDPTLHEALEEVEADGAQTGTIVQEAKRGYRYNGQVLRHALVKVAK